MKKNIFLCLMFVLLIVPSTAFADSETLNLVYQDKNITIKEDVITKGFLISSEDDIDFFCPCPITFQGNVEILSDDGETVVYFIPQLGGRLYFQVQTRKFVFSCPCEGCDQISETENKIIQYTLQQPEEEEEEEAETPYQFQEHFQFQNGR